MITILIIEESLLIGGRIRSLLLETPGKRTIYQSVDHKQAALLFEEIKPQAVLLDMCLPGTMSIELLQKIKNGNIPTAIIALVNCDDCHQQIKCTAFGADYILDKYHEFDKLPDTIDLIAKTRNPVSTNEKPEYYSKFA